MSIFGVKKTKLDNNLLERLNDLQRRFSQLNQDDTVQFDRQLTDVKKSMHDSRNVIFQQINSLQDNHNKLRTDVRGMLIESRVLQTKVEQSVITVWAEKRGALGKDAFEFGFGNAGRDDKTGYMNMKDGQITHMSVNVNKESGRVWVKLVIDGQEQDDKYGILLTGEKETIKFDTPIGVKAGSIISFISKVSNSRVVNCVVSVLIKI